MVPQSQAAIAEADVRVAAPARPAQKRWPVAFSILGAVAASLVMWAGIGWILSLFLGFLA